MRRYLTVFIVITQIFPVAYGSEIPFYLKDRTAMPNPNVAPTSERYKVGTNPYASWLVKRALLVSLKLKDCFTQLEKYPNPQTVKDQSDRNWILNKIKKKTDYLKFLDDKFKKTTGINLVEAGYSYNSNLIAFNNSPTLAKVILAENEELKDATPVKSEPQDSTEPKAPESETPAEENVSPPISRPATLVERELSTITQVTYRVIQKNTNQNQDNEVIKVDEKESKDEPAKENLEIAGTTDQYNAVDETASLKDKDGNVILGDPESPDDLLDAKTDKVSLVSKQDPSTLKTENLEVPANLQTKNVEDLTAKDIENLSPKDLENIAKADDAKRSNSNPAPVESNDETASVELPSDIKTLKNTDTVKLKSDQAVVVPTPTSTSEPVIVASSLPVPTSPVLESPAPVAVASPVPDPVVTASPVVPVTISTPSPTPVVTVSPPPFVLASPSPAVSPQVETKVLVVVAQASPTPSPVMPSPSPSAQIQMKVETAPMIPQEKSNSVENYKELLNAEKKITNDLVENKRKAEDAKNLKDKMSEALNLEKKNIKVTEELLKTGKDASTKKDLYEDTDIQEANGPTF